MSETFRNPLKSNWEQPLTKQPTWDKLFTSQINNCHFVLNVPDFDAFLVKCTLKSLYIQERTLYCWAPPSILHQIHHPISQRITTKPSRKHAYRPSFARETRFCTLFSCLKLPQWWKTSITVKITPNLANVIIHDNARNQSCVWPKRLFFTTEKASGTKTKFRN